MGDERFAHGAGGRGRSIAIATSLSVATMLALGACAPDTSERDSTSTSAAGTWVDEQAGAMIDDVTDAGDRARALAVEAAHRTLHALDVDLAAVDGASRVSECTDSLGSSTDARFGEYSSGTALESASISDQQLGDLAEDLDVEFQDDTVDIDGRRLVAFVLDIEGFDVIVRVSRLESGAVTLTTTTPCVD